MIHIYVLSDGMRAETAPGTAGAGVPIRRKMREKTKPPFPAARGLQTVHARTLHVCRIYYGKNGRRAGRTGPCSPENVHFHECRRAKRAKGAPAGLNEGCATGHTYLESGITVRCNNCAGRREERILEQPGTTPYADYTLYRGRVLVGLLHTGPLVLGISDLSHPSGLESTSSSLSIIQFYTTNTIVSVSLLQLLLHTQVRNWIHGPGATVPTSRVMSSPYVTSVRRPPAPSPRFTYP